MPGWNLSLQGHDSSSGNPMKQGFTITVFQMGNHSERGQNSSPGLSDSKDSLFPLQPSGLWEKPGLPSEREPTHCEVGAHELMSNIILLRKKASRGLMIMTLSQSHQTSHSQSQVFSAEPLSPNGVLSHDPMCAELQDRDGKCTHITEPSKT